MSLFRYFHRRHRLRPLQFHDRPFTQAELAEHFRRGKRDNAEWYQALRQVIGEMVEERTEVIANPALANPHDSRAHAAGGLATLQELAAWIDQPGGIEPPRATADE